MKMAFNSSVGYKMPPMASWPYLQCVVCVGGGGGTAAGAGLYIHSTYSVTGCCDWTLTEDTSPA